MTFQVLKIGELRYTLVEFLNYNMYPGSTLIGWVTKQGLFYASDTVSRSAAPPAPGRPWPRTQRLTQLVFGDPPP